MLQCQVDLLGDVELIIIELIRKTNQLIYLNYFFSDHDAVKFQKVNQV